MRILVDREPSSTEVGMVFRMRSSFKIEKRKKIICPSSDGRLMLHFLEEGGERWGPSYYSVQITGHKGYVLKEFDDRLFLSPSKPIWAGEKFCLVELVDRNGQIRVILTMFDLGSGRESQIYEGQSITFLEWSRDNGSLIFLADEDRFFFDVEGGYIHSLNAKGVSFPFFGPDKSILLVKEKNKAHEIDIIDFSMKLLLQEGITPATVFSKNWSNKELKAWGNEIPIKHLWDDALYSQTTDKLYLGAEKSYYGTSGFKTKRWIVCQIFGGN